MSTPVVLAFPLMWVEAPDPLECDEVALEWEAEDPGLAGFPVPEGLLVSDGLPVFDGLPG